MGVWLIGAGSIKVKPQVDDELIKEYVEFSKDFVPEEYRDEFFPNTWFFDENNKLISIAGKFAEPSIWFCYVKKFFEERGYELEGDEMIIGECDPRFGEICKINVEKYQQWKTRVAALGN